MLKCFWIHAVMVQATWFSSFANSLTLMFLKDGTELQVFVAEVKTNVVGVAVIRREEVNLLTMFARFLSFSAQYFLWP